MPTTSIVIIGAGSASFGPSTLATIMRSPLLRGSRLGLVDLDPVALENMRCVAERMNREWAAEMTIAAATDRRELLPDAAFVIVSIEVPPREILWRLDWEIPVKHGLRQPYGENGGPGGLMHACRQIPPLMAIVRDMEALCPAALLINFSNPLPRLSRAVTKYSRIKTVGKCHQLDVGYAIVAILLAADFGLTIPDGVDLHSDPANVPFTRMLSHLGRQHFDIKAAGLNHFTWMISVRDKKTGEDLYPLLRRRNAERTDLPAHFEPLSRELFRLFGLCPVPGDTHLCEYIPWAHDPLARPDERYNLRLYDWGGNEAYRAFSQDMVAKMAAGSLEITGLRDSSSEGAVEIVEAVAGNLNRYEDAVNIPNEGAIPNLPAEAIVELPALVSGEGVQGIMLPPLPEPMGELCRREAALVEMVVDTAVTGDRQLALQTLLMDPMINDIERAKAILDDYLISFADYLPQFSH